MFELITAVGSGALLLFTLAVLLGWKKKTPKLRALLMLGVGSGVIGLVTAALAVFGSGTAAINGTLAMIASVATLVGTFIVVHDLWPKNSATNTTGWVALVLPAFAALAGGGIVSRIVGSTSGAIAGFGQAIMDGLF